jgi:hypothetical protein
VTTPAQERNEGEYKIEVERIDSQKESENVDSESSAIHHILLEGSKNNRSLPGIAQQRHGWKGFSTMLVCLGAVMLALGFRAEPDSNIIFAFILFCILEIAILRRFFNNSNERRSRLSPKIRIAELELSAW